MTMKDMATTGSPFEDILRPPSDRAVVVRRGNGGRTRALAASGVEQEASEIPECRVFLALRRPGSAVSVDGRAQGAEPDVIDPQRKEQASRRDPRLPGDPGDRNRGQKI